MKFRERKERQRIQLFNRYSLFGKNATLLEIGTGDGIFATWIKKIYGYKIRGYDIQHMLSPNALLDAYHVGGDEVLVNILATQKFDGIIIAYTLHHMDDSQINHLFSLLHTHSIPIVILEETYRRTKLFVALNDILSNIFQYGVKNFNFIEYFQLNFKTVSSRNIFFQKAGFTTKEVGKKVRYGYVRTQAFLLKK